MWWCDRRRLILLAAAAALSGCAGFTPVHAPGGPGEVLRGQVRAAPPRDAAGFLFALELERALGPASPTARFDLDHAIALSEAGVGLTREGATTRYALTGTLTWTLSEGGTPRATGRITEQTTWSAVSSTVVTTAPQDDARRRLIGMLAQTLAARLTAEAARAGGWR